MELVTKPIKASSEELKNNVRARSAVLRVAQKLSPQVGGNRLITISKVMSRFCHCAAVDGLFSVGLGCGVRISF